MTARPKKLKLKRRYNYTDSALMGKVKVLLTFFLKKLVKVLLKSYLQDTNLNRFCFEQIKFVFLKFGKILIRFIPIQLYANNITLVTKTVA